MTDITENSVVSRSAYLLFYRRVHPEHQQQQIEQQSENSSMPSLSPLSPPSSPYRYIDSYSLKPYPVQQHHGTVSDECESYEEDDWDKSQEKQRYINSYSQCRYFSSPHGHSNRSPTQHRHRNRTLISSSPCERRSGHLRNFSSDEEEEHKEKYGNKNIRRSFFGN